LRLFTFSLLFFDPCTFLFDFTLDYIFSLVLNLPADLRTPFLTELGSDFFRIFFSLDGLLAFLPDLAFFADYFLAFIFLIAFGLTVALVENTFIVTS